MASKVETNPYGVDPIELLEVEIFQLIEELGFHRVMSKVKTKGPNIHTRLMKVKKKTLDRLINIHPYGEDYFLSH